MAASKTSIYVLNGPAPRDTALYNSANLKPVINSFEQAEAWLKATSEARRRPACALHIDTGMNRLGMTLDDVERLSRNKSMLEKLVPMLVMSHLACAPDKDSPMNAEQLARFKKAAARFPIVPMSLANSPGVSLGKPYHFQMVRAGLGLFAKDITNNAADNFTENTVSLMAPVLQVKLIKKGESLGYNASYVATENMKIAIVAAGYADGIPVSASRSTTSKGGFAKLHGRLIPIIGRVSMDLTILDVTGFSRPVQLGDWAEFMGDDLLAFAKLAGTIPYELMTRLGTRSRRDYFSSDANTSRK